MRKSYISECVRRLIDGEKAQDRIWSENLSKAMHTELVSAMIETLEKEKSQERLRSKLQCLSEISQLLAPDVKNTTLTITINKSVLGECELQDISEAMKRVTLKEILEAAARRRLTISEEFRGYFREIVHITAKVDKAKEPADIRAESEERHEYQIMQVMIQANLRAC